MITNWKINGGRGIHYIGYDLKNKKQIMLWINVLRLLNKN